MKSLRQRVADSLDEFTVMVVGEENIPRNYYLKLADSIIAMVKRDMKKKTENKLKEKLSKLVKEQKDLPPEVNKVIEERFWELF